MSKIYKIISIIVFLVTLSGVTNRFIAQDDPIFIIEGRSVDATSKKIEGVTVVIKKGGTVVSTTKTSSSGKFQDIELGYGAIYTVTYSKSGYITKSITIDAKTDFYAEDVEDLSVFPADITMLKAEPNVNYSIISGSPVAKVKIDPATGGLDYDRGYISKRGKEIAKFLEETANKGKKEQELFDKLVKEGDAGVTSKSYEAAIASYTKALAVKDDAGVTEKIAQAKHFLEKQKEAEARDKVYNEKMAAAAKTLAEKDYSFAKTQYKEAAQIKPDEQAPKDKIKEIEGIIQKQLEAEQKYNQLMADGEKAILSKNYDDAISKYTEASKLKPSEQLPKDQLAKAKKLKSEEDAAAEKEKQYNDLITKADGLFDGNSLAEAKTTYQEALGVKPGEAHPTGRITEIDKKLADEAANAEKEKQYNDLITKADGLFDGNSLAEAKTTYQEALGVKPGEAHPTGRITEIDKKLADEAANAEKEKQYNDLITKADGLFDGNSLAEAKTTYQEALGVKPGETHPTGRITEIDKKLADEAANAEKEKQYNDLITKADGLFDGNSLAEAKTTYQEALGVKPGEAHPTGRITEIDKKLADEAANAEKEKQYNDLITKADGLFDGNSLAEAKTTYQEALGIKPGEAHPTGRITEIDKKLADEAANAEKEKQYNDLITKADGLFDGNSLAEAKTTYQEALGVKPGEAHPTGRITEIDKKLADEAANAEKEKQYNDLITKADGLFDGNSLAEAKTTYQEALGVKPGEAHPTGRITEIDKKLADEAANAEKEKQYNDLITKADGLFDGNSLAEAKTTYQEALGVKPGEAHPTGRITEIDKKLADEAANAEKEKQYNDLITKADGLFDGNSLAEAKTTYQEALGVKPGEAHPTGRITEIDKKLADEAANAEKEKQYNDLITKADGLFDGNSLAEAKTTYQEALGVKPGETHPTGRITEIDKKLADEAANAEKEKQYNDLITKADGLFDGNSLAEAKTTYQEALGVKPGEAHPTGRITEIDKKLNELSSQAELEKKYNDLIEKADGLFDGEEFEKAKTSYQEALGVKPGEAHPTGRITEIDKILADLAAANADAAAKKALQDKFDGLMAKADGLRDAATYEEAKDVYKAANAVISTEPRPQIEIDKINEILKNNSGKEAYQKIIDKANELFGSKEYEKSKGLFERAKGLNPDDTYPPQKIIEIDKILANLAAANADAAAKKALQDKFDGLMAKADGLRDAATYEEAKDVYKAANAVISTEPRPQIEIDKINEILKNNSGKEAYQKIIDKANELFGSKEYEKSKGLFERAKGLNPDDTYPPQKIIEIDKILANLAAANADAAAKKALQDKFDGLMAKADGLRDAATYEEAKDVYKAANAVISTEPRPQIEIDKINEILKNNSGKEAYQKIIDKANELFGSKEYEKSKGLFERAKGLNPDDAYPPQKIIEIDKILANLAAANADAAAKKALQDKFDGLMAKADGLRDAATYEEAKDVYKAANAVISTEPRPQIEIDKINEILKNNSGKEAYQKIIDKANELFGSKEYEKSKGLFERAKGLNPDDTYPPQKIIEIDKILANLAAANSDAAAKKALQDKFDGLMAKADGLKAKGDASKDVAAYQEAKEIYKAANKVISTEPRPQIEIDKINNLLKGLEDGLEEEQYRKIIAKADELFGEKAYAKAKGLYQRAKGFKPSDSYPPAQISKIDDLLASMANQEELDRKYNEFISKADDKFDSEQYKESLNSYQSALSLKPSEPYPKKRIEELKLLMNKKEEPVATNLGDIPTYVFGDYGEETTIDEHTADNILQNSQINKDDIRQEQMVIRKEKESAIKNENSESHQIENDKLNEKLSNYQTEKEKESFNLNEKSKENIPEIEQYKIKNDEIGYDNQNVAKELTYDINTAQTDFNTERALKNSESDEKSRDNVPEVASYKNERENGKFEVANSYKDVTYSHFESSDNFQTDRNLATIASDTKSRDNVPEVAAYKNERLNGQFESGQSGKESTYTNYSEKEKLIDRFEEVYEKSDVPRERNASELAAFEKDLNFKQFGEYQEAKGNTYDHSEASTVFNTKRTEKNTEEAQRQIDNAPEVEKYKESVSEIQTTESELAQNKSDKINEANESFAQKQDAFNEDIKNVNEGNAEGVINYKDKKESEDVKESRSAIEKLDEGMDEIEEIKSQKVTKFSDANANYLASQFPEGVTEKTFQRKDNNDNIIEVTTIRIVVIGNKGNEYKKVASRWATTYFKNGSATSAQVWDTDTN